LLLPPNPATQSIGRTSTPFLTPKALEWGCLRLPVGTRIINQVSTAQEIEDAIRALSSAERDKLLRHLPQIFPEFAGDSEWERIAQDERSRPGLTELLNRYETDLSDDPEKFPKIAESDFESRA
jgi:hypothetical protein